MQPEAQKYRQLPEDDKFTTQTNSVAVIPQPFSTSDEFKHIMYSSVLLCCLVTSENTKSAISHLFVVPYLDPEVSS